MIRRLLIAAALALAVCPPVLAQAPTGDTPKKYFSAANLNPTSVKGSGGSVTGIIVVNTTATIYYLKFYDKATAPTCQSDTVVMTIPIVALTDAPTVISMPNGIIFRTGIAFCLTGGLADNDATNAATGVAINLTIR